MDLHLGVVGVLVGLGPVAFHDQPVVAVGLDVNVALAAEGHHLNGQAVANPVVEQHRPARIPDLGPLIADEGVLEAQPAHPGHRARERASGAGDHNDPGRLGPPERGHVGGVQPQVPGQQGAVQVHGQQPRPRYRATSGLRRLAGRPPRRPVARPCAAIAHISERVRTEALAMWGASTTLAWAARPGWRRGSNS